MLQSLFEVFVFVDLALSAKASDLLLSRKVGHQQMIWFSQSV